MTIRVTLIAVPLLLTTACAHSPLPGKGVWGEKGTLSPGWPAVKRAAVHAAADPYTWVPVVGAAVMQIGDADQTLADDIRRDKPLFGSEKTAKDASDWLRLGSLSLYIGLALGAPGPQESDEWWRAKGRGFVSGGTALAATIGTTEGLKSLIDRTRPNGENTRSLPSGHTSITATAARLSADTLDYYRLNPGARLAAGAGLFSLTAATAWARMEAGKHYPSDVLLGAALGNFFARFTTEAFLHPAFGEHAAVRVEPLSSGGALSLYLVY